jgi:hypothetical protein
MIIAHKAQGKFGSGGEVRLASDLFGESAGQGS